jgi:hypothetical protein
MDPIIYNEWETLGAKWETGDALQEDQCLFVTCDHIAALFRTHGHQLKDKIIVSAASDYGVSPQKKYPPDEDLRRWFPMQPLRGIGYRDLHLPARLDQGKCLQNDLYAIRSYSWMHSTFNDTPQCLGWFCTNSEISANHHIPFGVDRESWALIQKYKDTPKQDRVFCAWSNNTNERHSLMMRLRGVGGFVQFEELDKEAFIYELSSSKYCLCPEGNGKDSYRVLQALYSGSIPLLSNNNWSPYGDLISLIDCNTLNISISKQTNWELVDFNFWRKQIDSY